MCQQILQFFSGSTKPLLFVGALLSFLLAIAIGYTGCTTNALYNDIDPQGSSSRSLEYFLQLTAAGYLTLITIFSCYAAYYDQKHSIRALAFISSLNLVLAVVAILMLPGGNNVGQLFKENLEQAAKKYDFTHKGPMPRDSELDLKSQLDRANSTTGEPTVLEKRQLRSAQSPGAVVVREFNKTEATLMWDRLQARGCCGIVDGTLEWKSLIPKTCCSQPISDKGDIHCKEIDANHKQGCLALIESASSSLFIVLALIALVNFYLALITSISAYRTFHYDEASQSAYS